MRNGSSPCQIQQCVTHLSNKYQNNIYRAQPIDFLKDDDKFHRKRNEFSGFVDATFNGGVISKPLLDPIKRPTTAEIFKQNNQQINNE